MTGEPGNMRKPVNYHPIADLDRVGRKIFRLVALSLIGILVLWAQDSKEPRPSKVPEQRGAQPSPNLLPPLQLDGQAALHHLNQLISWYRHSTTGIQMVGLPSDAIYQDNTQSFAAEAVRLAFQSAKAEAALIVAQQKNNGASPQSGETTQQQNLAQMEARTSSQIDQLQSQIATLNSQIEKAPAARRGNLISQRDALQGELELQKALLEAIQKMTAFVENNGEISGGLEGSVNQLARSIPEVLASNAPAKKTGAAPAPAKPSVTNSGGLISEAILLYDYMSAEHQLSKISEETTYTRDTADRLRAPLRDALRATIQESQTLANQPPATDPQQLQAERQNFRELTERFKQLSGALLPLSQEIIVLNDGKTNFEEWRNSIARESKYVLRSVLVRVFAILLALAVILVLSEVWRRITFRYIGDPRRRRQFLVMRRVVMGFLIVVVLIVPKADADLTAEQVHAHARARLAGYKRPKYVVFADALPKNPSGKILKRDLRQRHASLADDA